MASPHTLGPYRHLRSTPLVRIGCSGSGLQCAILSSCGLSTCHASQARHNSSPSICNAWGGGEGAVANNISCRDAVLVHRRGRGKPGRVQIRASAGTHLARWTLGARGRFSAELMCSTAQLPEGACAVDRRAIRAATRSHAAHAVRLAGDWCAVWSTISTDREVSLVVVQTGSCGRVGCVSLVRRWGIRHKGNKSAERVLKGQRYTQIRLTSCYSYGTARSAAHRCSGGGTRGQAAEKKSARADTKKTAASSKWIRVPEDAHGRKTVVILWSIKLAAAEKGVEAKEWVCGFAYGRAGAGWGQWPKWSGVHEEWIWRSSAMTYLLGSREHKLTTNTL
ncbi:hypothetical protein B0H10DRAFT_1944029 [Mycena sp. CBHHK59/15]|nr:hypothetical protein B0H10DRAFT_1944029 [Mycena sp. CBHHK59/15]